MVLEEYILDLLNSKKELCKRAYEEKDLDLMIYFRAQISCLIEILSYWERSFENESKQ